MRWTKPLKHKANPDARLGKDEPSLMSCFEHHGINCRDEGRSSPPEHAHGWGAATSPRILGSHAPAVGKWLPVVCAQPRRLGAAAAGPTAGGAHSRHLSRAAPF